MQQLIGFAVVAATCWLAADASATLVGYYPFNGDAADASGNANHGNPGAAITFGGDTPTGGGQSAVFDGTNGGAGTISVPNSASLQSIDDQLTVAFWLKADGGANPNWFRIVRKGNEQPANTSWLVTRHFNNSDTLIRTDTVGGGSAFNQNRHVGAGTGVLDNQWHHIAYVLDNGSTKEYVDGALTSMATYPHGNGLSNTQNMLFGGRNGGDNMTGLMDDISVWNQAISAGAVRSLAAGVAATDVFGPLDLSSKFERDTLAQVNSEPTGNGYRFRSEVFVTNDFPGANSSGNIPSDGVLTFGGRDFNFGPIGTDTLSNNTWMFGVEGNAETDTLDISNARFNDMAILFSAVGYNQVGVTPANEPDGTFTVHYTDGTTADFPWDVADSDGAGLDGMAQIALGDLQLYDMDVPGAIATGRNMYVQVFDLDSSKVVDRISLSTVGVIDTGGSDAEFGVYAITGAILPVPEPMTASLVGLAGLALLRRRRAKAYSSIDADRPR